MRGTCLAYAMMMMSMAGREVMVMLMMMTMAGKQTMMSITIAGM